MIDAEGVLTSVLEVARPVIRVMKINPDRTWYRKPAGGRRAAWYSASYDFIDLQRWNKKNACIYFLLDQNKTLKHVGISVNRLKDGWRLSPAYDETLKPLGCDELFHSQCWQHVCEAKDRLTGDQYELRALYDSELVSSLRNVNHEISALSAFN